MTGDRASDLERLGLTDTADQVRRGALDMNGALGKVADLHRETQNLIDAYRPADLPVDEHPEPEDDRVHLYGIAELVDAAAVPPGVGASYARYLRQLGDRLLLYRRDADRRQNYAADVAEMHLALDLEIGERPGLRGITATLLAEEAKETLEAITGREVSIEFLETVREPSLVKAIDGLCDLLCVIFGAELTWGIDLPPFWREVHRTNLAKAGGPKRGDGKQLKPDGWTGPDLAPILADQVAAADAIAFDRTGLVIERECRVGSVHRDVPGTVVSRSRGGEGERPAVLVHHDGDPATTSYPIEHGWCNALFVLNIGQRGDS